MKSNLIQVADRVLTTLQLFKTKKHVTIKTISSELECSYSTALRYFQVLSLRLPIVAINEEPRPYHEAIQYKLMEEAK